MHIRLISALAAVTVVLTSLSLMTGCDRSRSAPAGPSDGDAAKPATAAKTPADGRDKPYPTGDPSAVAKAPEGADGRDKPRPTGDPSAVVKIPARFAADSPFEKGKDPNPPVIKQGKRIWANSFLFAEAPKLVVEKWLSEKPETKGKYVLVEFWATWCGPCRRSIPLLNKFHAKYGDELVVIGISDETEADVLKLKSPPIEYYSAIDTQGRTKKAVGVWGIPHVLIIEPGGAVIWQGFPLLKDYELTEDVIEKILAIGRKIKKQQEAQK